MIDTNSKKGLAIAHAEPMLGRCSVSPAMCRKTKTSWLPVYFLYLSTLIYAPRNLTRLSLPLQYQGKFLVHCLQIKLKQDQALKLAYMTSWKIKSMSSCSLGVGGGLFNALETHEKSLIGCPSVVNYRSAREFGDQSLLKMTDNLIVTLCIITEEMYLKKLCSLIQKKSRTKSLVF